MAPVQQDFIVPRAAFCTCELATDRESKASFFPPQQASVIINKPFSGQTNKRVKQYSWAGNIEILSSMCEVWGSIPGMETRQNKRTKQNKKRKEERKRKSNYEITGLKKITELEKLHSVLWKENINEVESMVKKSPFLAGWIYIEILRGVWISLEKNRSQILSAGCPKASGWRKWEKAGQPLVDLHLLRSKHST